MAKGMTKTQLVRAMAEKLELTNKQTATFFETLAETAVKETKKNGEFTIPGLGKLVKAERKARIGRNPATGAPVKIPARKRARITALKGFKDALLTPSLAPKLAKGVWPPEAAPAKKAPAKAPAKAAVKRAPARATAKKAPAKKAPARKAPARATAARKR